MIRRLFGVVGMSVLACATLSAANFWEEKPFLSWSDQEVEKLFTDSPWAQSLNVAVPAPPRESIQLGSQGGGDDINFGGPARRARVTVSWRTALPLRQAGVRRQSGFNGEIAPEAQDMLTRQDPFYVVAVSGIPMQFARIAPDAIQAESVLRRSGKPDIAASEVSLQRSPAGLILLVVFPKTDAVSIEDRDVEFVTKLDDFGVKRKFRLRDMVVGGSLQL